MTSAVVPSALPAGVLLVALGGQVKEQLAAISLLGGAFLVAWAVGLVVALGVQVARRGSYVPIVAGLATSALALSAVAALVLSAPLWAQWRASPAIAAIEHARGENGKYPDVSSFDGDFPTDIRRTLDASGHCIYKPRPTSYHLACLGVPFARCGYDGATKRWSGWE